MMMVHAVCVCVRPNTYVRCNLFSKPAHKRSAVTAVAVPLLTMLDFEVYVNRVGEIRMVAAVDEELAN